MDQQQEIKLAWAAGLFDGEGCAYLCKVAGHGYLSLSVGQCYNPEVLHRFADAVGHGNITGPHSSGVRNAPSWKWRATGKPAERIVDLLMPYLSSPKKDKIAEVRTKTGRMSSGEAEA